MGSRLPSAEEVLIIRPTGKQGQALLCSAGHPLSPGALSGSPAFRSRIRAQSGPDVNAVAAKLNGEDVSGKLDFPKNIFPERT